MLFFKSLKGGIFTPGVPLLTTNIGSKPVAAASASSVAYLQAQLQTQTDTGVLGGQLPHGGHCGHGEWLLVKSPTKQSTVSPQFTR